MFPNNRPSTFPKFPASICTAMRVIPASSSFPHMNASFARVHARQTHFSGRCSYPSSPFQTTKKNSRQLPLLPSHSLATAKSSVFSTTLALLLLTDAFLSALCILLNTSRFAISSFVFSTYQFSMASIEFVQLDFSTPNIFCICRDIQY